MQLVAEEHWRMSGRESAAPDPAAALLDVFTDDETVPVFDADLDLPYMPTGRG